MPFSIIRINAGVDGYPLSMTTRNGCDMPIVSGTRSICSSASRISSNLHLRQSLSRTILFMTSYRHPSPMDAWGFVPFLLDVPNSSRVSFVVGILIPEPSAARTKYPWKVENPPVSYLISYLSETAAIPGSVLPSRYSRDAPPPVEM